MSCSHAGSHRCGGSCIWQACCVHLGVIGRPHARFRILARCRCRNRRKVPLKRMSFLVEAASAAYGETCHYRRPTGGDRALKSLKPSMGLLGHHLLGKQRILLDCLLSPAPASHSPRNCRLLLVVMDSMPWVRGRKIYLESANDFEKDRNLRRSPSRCCTPI